MPFPSSSTNAEWLARSQAAVWHPCTQMRHHADPQQPQHLPLVPVARGDNLRMTIGGIGGCSVRFV